MKERIYYLDNAKSILIILMVICHVFLYTFLFDFVYNFHMMAFFFISGMLFQHTASLEKPYTSFVRSRIRSMVIPFLFFELWGVMTGILARGVELNVKGYIFNTLTLRFNNGAMMWFLFILFFAELFFVGTHKLFSPKPLHIALSVLLFLASLLIPTERLYLDFFARFLRAVFFLNAGYYFGQQFCRTKVWAAICAFIVLLALTVFNGRVSISEVTAKNAVQFCLGSFAGTYLVLSLAKLPFGKWFQMIGQNTLAIYCTHFTYYYAFSKLLGEDNLSKISLRKGILVLLLVALAEIPTVWLLNRFLPFAVGKRRRSAPQLNKA